VSWDYGRLVAEVYELDKPVGSSFPALRYYTRQLAGVTVRATGSVFSPRSDRFARAMLNGFGCCGR
jgi:hypothetical protein